MVLDGSSPSYVTILRDSLVPSNLSKTALGGACNGMGRTERAVTSVSTEQLDTQDGVGRVQ